MIKSFYKQIANSSTSNVVCTILLASLFGIAVVFYGLILEQHGEIKLLQSGGRVAVESYLAFLRLNEVSSVIDYITLAFQGRLPSFGGNAQGIGFALTFILPVLSYIAISIIKIVYQLQNRSRSFSMI